MCFPGQAEFVGGKETDGQQNSGGKDHQPNNGLYRLFRLYAVTFHKACLFEHQPDYHDGNRHRALTREHHHPSKDPLAALLSDHLVDIGNKAVDIPRDVIQARPRGTQQDKHGRKQQGGNLNMRNVDREQKRQHAKYTAVREA
ncbi:hypothetical protein D3C75_486320 [compost metagenome]